MTTDTPPTMPPYQPAPSLWHTSPTQFHAARTQPRSCGCDWDTRVFGHTYCWTIRFPNNHVTCHCTMCPCDCHHRER